MRRPHSRSRRASSRCPTPGVDWKRNNSNHKRATNKQTNKTTRTHNKVGINGQHSNDEQHERHPRIKHLMLLFAVALLSSAMAVQLHEQELALEASSSAKAANLKSVTCDGCVGEWPATIVVFAVRLNYFCFLCAPTGPAFARPRRLVARSLHRIVLPLVAHRRRRATWRADFFDEFEVPWQNFALSCRRNARAARCVHAHLTFVVGCVAVSLRCGCCGRACRLLGAGHVVERAAR